MASRSVVARDHSYREAEFPRARRPCLVILPLLLIPSTGLVFAFSARFLGRDWAYLLGFLFYWAVWCYLVPLMLLGRRDAADLFRNERSPLLRKKNWYLIALLLGTIIGAAAMYFAPRIADASLSVVLLAVPIAVLAGAGEELLWRGLFIRAFPGNFFWAFLYPTVWFALQHISPQLVEPSASVPVFVASTLPLGFTYGLVAYRTGSIRWNALAHVVISFLALGEPISTAIRNMVFAS